jgi:hypothetical protein
VSRLGPRGLAARVLALAAIVVAATLLIAGLRTIPVRTFALRVQDAVPVAVAGNGERVCEGPVRSSGPARSVGIFGTVRSGAPTVEVAVLSSAGRTLGSGRMGAGAGSEHLAALDRPIPGGVPVRVCVRSTRGTFTLLGASDEAVVKTHDVDSDYQFALVLTRPSSFLGSLGTAFSRASVFRPRWVGTWTFWLLLGALAATFGIAWLAVSQASADDEDAGSPQ